MEKEAPDGMPANRPGIKKPLEATLIYLLLIY